MSTLGLLISLNKLKLVLKLAGSDQLGVGSGNFKQNLIFDTNWA